MSFSLAPEAAPSTFCFLATAEGDSETILEAVAVSMAGTDIGTVFTVSAAASMEALEADAARSFFSCSVLPGTSPVSILMFFKAFIAFEVRRSKFPDAMSFKFTYWRMSPRALLPAVSSSPVIFPVTSPKSVSLSRDLFRFLSLSGKAIRSPSVFGFVMENATFSSHVCIS